MKETIEGIIFSPISLGIISTLPFRKTPIQHLLVPKSIPIAGAFSSFDVSFIIFSSLDGLFDVGSFIGDELFCCISCVSFSCGGLLCLDFLIIFFSRFLI